MRRLCLLATLLSACHTSPPAAPPPVPTGPIPLQKLVDAVTQENLRMVDLTKMGSGSAQLLGQLNRKMGVHGYFRRVPTDPALDSLDAQIRQLATDQQLVVTRLEKHIRPGPPVPPAQVLQAGDRWQPTVEQLRGVIDLAIDLQGVPAQVVKFIDALPEGVERLVIVQSAGRTDGGVRLLAEAYYERELPMPKVEVRWPSLDERLKAAGWRPDDPTLQSNPTYKFLKDQVDVGRHAVPTIRGSLQIVADFPRWFVRYQFYEDRARALAPVRGALVLEQAGIR